MGEDIAQILKTALKALSVIIIPVVYIPDYSITVQHGASESDLKMWQKIPCKKTDLQLGVTLCGGQCFRWRKTADTIWTGVFARRVWILSQTETHLLYQTYPTDITKQEDFASNKTSYKKSKANKVKYDSTVDTSEISNHKGELQSSSDEILLRQYFQLDVSLPELYTMWGDRDENFRKVSQTFFGVRILKQDPVENIFSFICSSNNHISRISSMVEKLCSFYGDKITEIDGVDYFSFPSIHTLANPSVEQKLRDNGFGYRAKFISQSAQKIVENGGEEWLEKLRSLPYKDAKSALMTLPGIGAKVADCICLMSLNHLEAVPVDTHVYQIASQKYLPHLKNYKSVTDRVYNEIGDYFRNLYGTYAGWAHTVLFCADLKMFQGMLEEGKEVAKSKSKCSRKRKAVT